MTETSMQTANGSRRELGPFAADAPAAEEKNWHLRRDDDGVAWLLFDCAGADVNTLSGEVLRELDGVLEELEKERPKALVLRSAKTSSFCVGADLKEIRELKDREKARELLQEGHRIFTRLAKLRCPTIAVIHGACLGGGLELALCCDYRLVVPGSKLGFPEVRLGLHPGLGGTARFTALVNPITAMTLMLTGKTIPDRKAKKMGLVDAVVEERHVAAALRAASKRHMKRQRRGFGAWLMSSLPLRKLTARRMRARSAKKAPPKHYPAPGALITLWEKHGGSKGAMLRHEVDSFVELLLTDTAANLIRVFFLREKMKRLATTGDADKYEPRHVHVVGAGEMGGDIAGWCALQGLTVTLADMKADVIAEAVKKVAKLCDGQGMKPAQKRDVLDRLIPDMQNAGVRRADVIIEAVPEKTDIKREVYADIEPRMKEGAILATNTSSIPLDSLQEKLQNPGRFVGLHFFNPVAKMKLVEVVSHEKAQDESLARARAFTRCIDKLPAPVTSAPGFLVNRALMPYLLEALLLLDEGVAPEAIDAAAEDFGMPMGPVELADQVGLDICLSVADMLRERLDDEVPALPEWFREKVDNGDLGKKTGQGLYTWRDGEAKKDRGKADNAVPDRLTDRLILPMLNACMACLRDGVIEDEDILDGAMIFGTGFAPFRGGPMHYAASRGFTEIRDVLRELAEEHGERFAPHDGWR